MSPVASPLSLCFWDCCGWPQDHGYEEGLSHSPSGRASGVILIYFHLLTEVHARANLEAAIL